MLIQKNLPHSNLNETLDRIILPVVESNDVIPTDVSFSETIYYIAGWLICAVGKESTSRKPSLSRLLEQLAYNCSLHVVEAEVLNLPVRKVNRLMAYGGLKYPARILFVCRIEKCFGSLLTNENLVIHRPTLNNIIMIYLQSCLLFKKYFCEFLDDSEDCLSKVSNYVIRTFARMRDKDITRRIMGQKIEVYHFTHDKRLLWYLIAVLTRKTRRRMSTLTVLKKIAMMATRMKIMLATMK